jgi:hypothetical protein
MENDDLPKIGRDFLNWSDLDSRLRTLNLEIELFRRQNVWIASFVILAGVLKGDQKQQRKYLDLLTPEYFDPKSLPKYLFEKIVLYVNRNESIPVSEIENWIPEFAIKVWGESPVDERMLFANQFTLRQILSFTPTEEQVYRAIELRREKMEKYGYESKE